EAVFCNRGDGLGIGMLKTAGIEVVVISKEKNPVVAARCRKLGIQCIQGCDNKLSALQAAVSPLRLGRGEVQGEVSPGGGFSLSASEGERVGVTCAPSISAFKFPLSALKSEEIAYVGNDINDLNCLRWVGLPIA